MDGRRGCSLRLYSSIVNLVDLNISPLLGIWFTYFLGEFCLGDLSILAEIITWLKSLKTHSSFLEVYFSREQMFRIFLCPWEIGSIAVFGCSSEDSNSSFPLLH